MIKIFESDKFSRNIKRKDSPLCIKLIPNVERIKIEKAQTAKDLKLKQLEMTEGEQIESISFDNDAGEISELSSIKLTTNYYESIFSLTDLYFYKGLCLVYMGQYADAI